MSRTAPGFELDPPAEGSRCLRLTGDWVQGQQVPDTAELQASLSSDVGDVVLDGTALGEWDSLLMAFLLKFSDVCRAANITVTTRGLPESAAKLLTVASAVPAHHKPEETKPSLLATLNPGRLLARARNGFAESLGFIGEVAIALGRLATGRANTRWSDFRDFCYQAGPQAFGIISLTSILVGMILAYLGAAQLQQFGAEIFVADLVVIGTLREMGVLMTAVVMAGRTGAAYAAQLGTMQTNEEIDAIVTMGISPMEFLVLPRMLALIVIMPLLTIYANLLSIIGGGIVAGGMGITPVQYITQGEGALAFSHLGVGLLKSVIYAALIAIAGCRAGINSGRSSAAVGQAATEAVVTAIVYLIVADAAVNIFFQQVGI